MSHTLKNYEPSTPTAQLQRMRQLVREKSFCPQCQRVAKWYYPYLEANSYVEQLRCPHHEVIPAPGPEHFSLERKVIQLY